MVAKVQSVLLQNREMLLLVIEAKHHVVDISAIAHVGIFSPIVVRDILELEYIGAWFECKRIFDIIRKLTTIHTMGSDIIEHLIVIVLDSKAIAIATLLETFPADKTHLALRHDEVGKQRRSSIITLIGGNCYGITRDCVGNDKREVCAHAERNITFLYNFAIIGSFAHCSGHVEHCFLAMRILNLHGARIRSSLRRRELHIDILNGARINTLVS